NVGTITVNLGGTFQIDNTDAAVNDRVRNASQITLAGSVLDFRGSLTTAVSEVVGTIQTNSNFSSTISTASQGQATTLSASSLSVQANSFVSFRAYGSDLGSANNKLIFYTPLLSQLVNNALPFATLSKPGDIDFVGYDAVKGVIAAPSRSTLAGASATDNVK